MLNALPVTGAFSNQALLCLFQDKVYANILCVVFLWLVFCSFCSIRYDSFNIQMLMLLLLLPLTLRSMFANHQRVSQTPARNLPDDVTVKRSPKIQYRYSDNFRIFKATVDNRRLFSPFIRRLLLKNKITKKNKFL